MADMKAANGEKAVRHDDTIEPVTVDAVEQTAMNSNLEAK